MEIKLTQNQIAEITSTIIGRGKISKWPPSKLNERMRRLINATLRAYSGSDFGNTQATKIAKLLVLGWHKRVSNQDIIDNIEQVLLYGRIFAGGPSKLTQAVHNILNAGDL